MRILSNAFNGRAPLRTRSVLVWVVFACLFAFIPASAQASEGHGVSGEIWLIIAGILVAAKLGGEAAARLKQPPVLGELFAGIILGNLGLVGFGGFDHIPAIPSIEFLAELGVVLLLFEVGLESTLADMRRVAPQSGAAAIIGIVVPMILGYGSSYFLQPAADNIEHLFVGATLCATSVGITARVLKDLGALSRPETRVILGAAVIDDVLGLIVLAVVSAIALNGALPGAVELASIIGMSFGFLIVAVLLGLFVMPGIFRVSARMRSDGVLAALSIGLCLFLAGASAVVGLAAIVGAFAAGLILDKVHVRPFGKAKAEELSEIVAPIVKILTPIFFVRTGMLVKLDGLTPDLLILAGLLSVSAIIGKLVCGLGVRGSKIDRLTVGIGMIPRGEVGLIFANVGAAIVVNGHRVISPGIYTAVVLMVMITTVVTPPWLAARLRKLSKREATSREKQGAVHAGA